MTEGPYGGQDSRQGDQEPPEDTGQAAGRVSGQEGRTQPEGDAYAWYQRGIELLGKHSPAAAAQLLERAADAEPGSRMVREALARAQFDAGWYELAVQNFRKIVEASPADDYAHFGLGLALARCGDPGHAAEYLALAAAMRPDLPHYSAALRDVRATLRARADGAHNDGAHNDGAHNDGAHNDGAHNDGGHNDGAHNDGGHNDGGHNDGVGNDGPGTQTAGG
jgi:predicted Zn-dependent protease